MPLKKMKLPEDPRVEINKHLLGRLKPAVLDEAIRLAYDIASNERAMKLLRKDNEVMRKELQELFVTYSITHINVSFPTLSEDNAFNLKMIGSRGFIPVAVGLTKMISVRMKKTMKDLDAVARKKIAKDIAQFIEPFMRKDAISVTATRETKWGKELETDMQTNTYLYITPGVVKE